MGNIDKGLLAKFKEIALKDLVAVIKLEWLEDEIANNHITNDLFSKVLTSRLRDPSDSCTKPFIEICDLSLAAVIDALHVNNHDNNFGIPFDISKACDISIPQPIDCSLGTAGFITQIVDNALNKAIKSVEEPSATDTKAVSGKKDSRFEQMRQDAAEFAGASQFTFGR